ncbi:MAG TPA: UDP-N-acetylglucosamine 2-epimerase (non-hydrolyzing), partial [Balneolaceae bacterium]|nr:UDP-N-acetylglucosamine 2-epimerase (non-hydrolyzing) [Balneolaceae bacterium]
MEKLAIVVGTRPNFIKITQFNKIAGQLYSGDIDIRIIHTGQHYDHKMANVFFEQFDLTPDVFLEIPPQSPNTQMAEVMLRLEKILDDLQPDLLMVVGDVNSTLAAALTANKMDIKLAHLESGLRSFDRSMPEEINRILTDEIADYFFVTEDSGKKHLLEEGKNEEQIYFVGNTMIDTMVAFDDQIKNADIIEKLNLDNDFALVTIHRPATVDNKEGLQKMIRLLHAVSERYQVVFPIHPRTVDRLEKFDLLQSFQSNKKLTLTEPMDYFSFQKLIQECTVVLTDSGGIQEEATYRKVPCLTLRPNTERPSTIN